MFAIDFDESEISKLSPIRPTLKPGAQPVFAKPRRMSLKQLDWLQQHINQTVRLGMLKQVENPVWGIPVFVVKKPYGKGWRMVADFRALNSLTLPSSLPMPLLEQLIECTSGSNIFASLVNFKGFNLLRALDSEPFTLVTPFGCFQMMVRPKDTSTVQTPTKIGLLMRF